MHTMSSFSLKFHKTDITVLTPMSFLAKIFNVSGVRKSRTENLLAADLDTLCLNRLKRA